MKRFSSTDPQKTIDQIYQLYRNKIKDVDIDVTEGEMTATDRANLKYSPLMEVVVKSNDVESLNILLDNGVAPDTLVVNDQYHMNVDWTPLLYSLIKEHYKMAHLLIDYGADVFKTPVYTEIGTEPSPFGYAIDAFLPQKSALIEVINHMISTLETKHSNLVDLLMFILHEVMPFNNDAYVFGYLTETLYEKGLWDIFYTKGVRLDTIDSNGVALFQRLKELSGHSQYLPLKEAEPSNFIFQIYERDGHTIFKSQDQDYIESVLISLNIS